MISWLDISPLINGTIFIVQVLVATFTRRLFIQISPLLFSILFANIVVSFILAVSQ